jgi:glucokinase
MPPDVVFAADLGGTKLAAALVNREGKIIARAVEPVDTTSAGAPIAQIVGLAAALSSEAPNKKFRAAAVAVPGLVRCSGTVWAPNLPGWERVPLASRLRRQFGVPATVESDRNCAVLGELWRGGARGKRDAIVLIVGTGIGAGIVAGGQLLRGAHELSGCAGWMVVSHEAKEDFARIGCLEALAAGPAIAREAQRVLPKSYGGDITALTVAEAARRGDASARAIFTRAGEMLGLGIANLISLFDPEVVILGGGLAAAADLFFDSMRNAALRAAQPLAARQVQIKISKLGGDANLLGAAHLAWSMRK